MSNEHESIHEFDLELICRYFSNLERQGPGSPEVTAKALSFVDNLDASSVIADLGCGTGGQTMVLAEHTPGKITGIDIFPRFIELFNANAQKQGVQERVQGVEGSMDALTFEEESLDLIWSEGAIYNIGFERGLREWRKYLKPGGFLAVSEAAWLTDERPAEIEDFWMDAYPEINTISNQIAILQQAGYSLTAAFVLPEICWTDHFFAPQVEVQKVFLEENSGNQSAEGFIANMRREAELYDKYKEHYGYVFYIGKKKE